MGADLVLNLNRIRFFPYSKWMVASNYLIGATLEGSNNLNTWDNLATIDSTVHSGWNIIPINSPNNYRYIRFAHTNVSKCSLAEFEL